jgi:hypothetical protein
MISNNCGGVVIGSCNKTKQNKTNQKKVESLSGEQSYA